MKRIIAFILMLVMVLSLASCSLLPETLKNSIDDIKNNIFGSPDVEEDEHVHDFVVVDSKDATCTEEGFEKLECTCGETKENVIEALGHDMRKISGFEATCTQYGSATFICKICSIKKSETYEPTGHIYSEFVEPSRHVTCIYPGCYESYLVDSSTGKYDEALKFTFGDAEKAALEAKYEELKGILESSERYNPALHAYAEEGTLADAYAQVEAIYEEYTNLIFSAQGQYSIAMTLYYCDNANKELEAIYNDMMEYYNELVSKYYSLSQPWYDSMYREFYFYGATEEEINSFLFDSNAIANPEYTALKDRNDAIELEYYSIGNPIVDDRVPELYEEFVANNNRIAEILGYDNYLAYAYQNVYDRDYTYQDVAAFVEYVRTYMAPMYNRVYRQWQSAGNYATDKDIDTYYQLTDESFFVNPQANALFNDYIDDMNMAFTSNPDKQISFSDHLNNLMSDGNLFQGTYEGAYVTFIVDGGIPIAYFGDGYNNTFTVAHEFGHYMNEVYNMSEYNQSFDLLETHSQGDEMLYLYYLKDYTTSNAYHLVKTYQILNALYIIMMAVQVDCFEQAIYLNSYDGPNSEIIMADGKITADEYDLLYASISEYLGIEEEFRADTYWRYGMTITSPCYYISYSVSAINALQIYQMANTDSFEAAKESYLKLFTYTDENPDMTTEEVLRYAGLLSYNDEQLYINLNEYFMK